MYRKSRIDRTLLKYIVVAALAMNLSSCATVRLANQGNIRSPIEQGSYRIDLKNDSEWQDWAVSIKQEHETVLFEQLRTWPLTGEVLGKIMIVAFKNEAPPERWSFTGEQIADEVRTIEERIMIEKGALAGTYSLSDVTKDAIMVGGKKLYRMSYRTQQGAMVGETVLCVYVPANYKETHSFYEFLINGSFKRGRGIHIDFDYIVPVIEGFHLRSQ